ncbi:hypothetical protein FRB91_009932 [Serendipita sp. 411]|nr:hypothetical protein FRB91_009932 [Serendipita sp. 411]
MSDQRIAEHRTFKDYGPGNLEILDDDEEEGAPHYTFRTLVKPFVIKQWVYKGKIYRERKERVPSRFELFFDLVFVAIAHQLSDSAAEHASGVGLAQFVLVFFPTWGLWNETRAFINASGTDDVLQRAGVLFMMALLLGYTANASAITLFYKGSEGETTVPTTEASPASEAGGHLLAAVAAEAGSAIVGHRDAALVTATVFFLIAKAFRILFFVMYAAALPRFRVSLLFQCTNQVIGFFLYFPLLFVHNKKVIVVLASLGMAQEILMRYTIVVYKISLDNLVPERLKSKPADSQDRPIEDPSSLDVSTKNVPSTEENEGGILGSYIPALNIEHFLERTAAFVVIVLGEMVLSVVYHATPAQVGFKNIYGKAICGLMIAFNFCWLYFDAECSHRFLHALRRHWFTGLTFTNLHYPLSAALILAGAATSRMTQEDEVTEAINWYFGGGLGVAMFTMALIGFTHRNLDPTGTTRLGRNTQLGLRCAVGVVMICLPLSKLNPLEMMGTCAGLTSFLVVEETFGKLHRGEPISKPNASEQDLHAQRNDEITETTSKVGETKEGLTRKAD